jgi:precorrin-6Y C5,15-methyltransferase (decarboxylating)
MSSSGASRDGAIAKWLAIVGIGEDGAAGLGQTAKQLISDAAFVFGGKRHLDHASALIRGEAHAWPVPFDDGMTEILRRRGQSVCVLASGDPFQFGVGVTLARHVDPAEMTVIPVPSAFSLAAAKLGWALQEIDTISLHGRPLDLLRPLLHSGRRILALTTDGTTPAAVAALLEENGFGESRLHVLEALGGPNEAIRRFHADEEFNALNLLAIEIVASPEARILPLAPGLADDLFEHDGQITKREIRALTLSALAPRRGDLLWDIGAGAGSIAIEWMLADPSLRALAIESDPERAARIRRNASGFGVPDLRIVEGEAPGALAGLPVPDAIFIGGGGSAPGLVDAAIAVLRPGGRLVANAVTIEMETLLLGLHDRLGGGLSRIALSRASKLGAMRSWRPAMPVTQWIWSKA